MEGPSNTADGRSRQGSAASSPQQRKIIVGLDFGTTFSGMCWTMSDGDAKGIHVIKDWPNWGDTVSKIPSRMAYTWENPALRKDEFGFIGPQYRQVTWFKLHLDDEAAPTEFDDPNMRHPSDPWQDRLPRKLTAKQVTKDFLHKLYNVLLDTLERTIFTNDLRETPIEVWLTVPASWSDSAKIKTRDAAIEAGFGKHPKDTVNLITEPEAAAIFALNREVNNNVDLVKSGETFIVCDCGGGTVDLTAYGLKSRSPNLEFQEICKGKAGKCGATMIDRAFCRWMEHKFGEAYTEMPEKQRGPSSFFMVNFDKAKAEFSSEKREFFEIGPIVMDVPRSSKYNKEDSVVNLSWKTLRAFFDQAITHILNLLGEQLREARTALGGQQVNSVILVGGLGNNLYVRERVDGWCKQQRPALRLISPPYGESQTCIMKGAAMRGLLGMKPTYRVSRRHYGFGVSLPFRPGVDSTELGWDDDDGEKMCFERVEWLVRKGQFVENDFQMEVQIRRHFMEREGRKDVLELWACDDDDAPEYDNDPRLRKVASIRYDFRKSDFKGVKRTFSNTLKTNCRALNYNVRANMAAEEGVLIVKVAGSRQFGSANVIFHEMD